MFEFREQARNWNALVYRTPGGKQLSRKPAATGVLLGLMCPSKHMYNSVRRRASFNLTVSTSQEQRSVKAAAVLGRMLEGGVRNNSQMGRRGVQPFVCESLGMFLDPCEELGQLDDVLKLWLGCVLLQCTDVRNNIHSGVCKIRDGAKEILVQLTKIWTCFVIGPS